MAQQMPMPLTVSCFSKIQIGFTSLVPAHPGSPGKGPLNVCVWGGVYVQAMMRPTCNTGAKRNAAMTYSARLITHRVRGKGSNSVVSVRPFVCFHSNFGTT